MVQKLGCIIAIEEEPNSIGAAISRELG